MAIRKITLLLAVIVSACFAPGASAQARRVKALFLGDRGHHQPLERLRQVHSPFSQRGIDIDYAEEASVLNTETLARYDTLILYSNLTRITPEQEKALLDYVAGGKGFVPIHCASACFGNSRAVIALMGARFKSHGTGVFKETWVKGDHVIYKGLKPIENWDETYVHDSHNEKDRELLAVREEGTHKEPWTWTRTHGKGRVFYTAWGHDQRTWGNESFINLIERGIKWASGDWALEPAPAQKPFEFVEANVPNYVRSQRWGTLGENFKTMQSPVSPQESMKHIATSGGIDLKLWAAEPSIKKPICMAFDERGRLWVAETIDYPNELKRDGEGRDQITICEDTNSDGVADKFTVFAEKLSIPTSMVHANGGLIIVQAPHTIFLKDTNGDDKADERKVLFTGWGTNDTHAGPSNLRYGFDGWVYGTCGYSAFRGEVGGKRVSFGQGMFRFLPDGSALEFLGSTSNNTWGLGISEDNHVFASTANNDPSFYMSIPNRAFETVKGWSARGSFKIYDTPNIWAMTEKVRQVDQHGKYTAGAGHALYTARSFPREYWNRAAFIAEPTGHLLGRFMIDPVGASFAARNDFHILASDDEWCAPIIAEVGPDGALWVVDWYNYIVQHNPIPRGFQGGKGGAYETPLRDKRHGRVYRLTYAAGKPSASFDLSKADTAGLLAALKSDNMLWRMHAQRLIAERGAKDAIPGLLAIIADKSVDAIGLNAPAIHALWALKHLGGINDNFAAVSGALAHPSAGVRRAALDVIPGAPNAAQAMLDAKLLEDKDAHVRKNALLAIAQLPPSDAAGAAVFAFLTVQQNQNDKVLTDAATIAAAQHDSGFLKSAFAAYQSNTSPDSIKVDVSNRMPNPSFEQGNFANPAAWRPRHYNGTAKAEWVDGGRTGKKCLKISSETGADSSWFADVSVQPNTEYRLSVWIKTENLQIIGSGMGAMLNIHGTNLRTRAISGNNDWRKIEYTFNSGPRDVLSINCLYGGFGKAKGVACFDDIELVPVGGSALPGALGRAISVVSGHYAQRGDVNTLVGTLTAMKKADPVLAGVMIEGLASGWPASAKPNFSDADLNELRGLMTALPPAQKDKMLVLADRWGRKDLFSAETAAMAKDLRVKVADAKAAFAQRIDAAKKLVSVDDSADAVRAILAQVDAQSGPDLQKGLLDALAPSKVDEVGALIVKQWAALSPTAQRAALALLTRKPAWTTALLDGLDKGAVNAKDLAAETWQTLTINPDAALADRAKKLQTASGRAPSPDKKKIIDGLAHVAERKGDLAKGKEVYAKVCAVCHTIEGQGGKVGPDLTGIGARPKIELLSEVIDPNRSVEGTYRQWTVETEEDTIYGRLLTESQTAVELIDATGVIHAIQRKDIKIISASERSIMPEGFDQALSADEFANLLEFLSHSNVKH